jgi:predicted site-specific integrase-resolvase
MPVKRTSGKAKTKRVLGQPHKQSKMFRAGLYARVSTLDQQTLPLQMRAMREYATKRGWTIAMQVKEVGSGAIAREQRQELIDAARRREIDVVLVWRLDRWGRSLMDLVTTLQELSDLNVGFVSLTEALDLTTSTGRAMAGMLGCLLHSNATYYANAFAQAWLTPGNAAYAWVDRPQRQSRRRRFASCFAKASARPQSRGSYESVAHRCAVF